MLRHSRADGTLDALGLTVMLAEESPSLAQTDVDVLVQFLFERFGVKPGGRVSSTRVLQWLVGTQGSVIQSSLRDVDLNSASQPAQLLAKLAAAKLPAQVPLKAGPQPEPVMSPLTKPPAEVRRSTADAEATVQATLGASRMCRCDPGPRLPKTSWRSSSASSLGRLLLLTCGDLLLGDRAFRTRTSRSASAEKARLLNGSGECDQLGLDDDMPRGRSPRSRNP